MSEVTNYARLSAALVEVCRNVLWAVLVAVIPAKDLPRKIKAAPNLRLSQEQKLKLCKGVPCAIDADTSALYTLIRNFCDQEYRPTKGWDNRPGLNETTVGDDIERIRQMKNALVGHSPVYALPAPLFQQYWSDLSNILTRLDLAFGTKSKDDLHVWKTKCMDQDLRNLYEQKIKENKEAIDVVQQATDENKQAIDENKQTIEICYRQVQEDKHSAEEGQSKLETEVQRILLHQNTLQTDCLKLRSCAHQITSQQRRFHTKISLLSSSLVKLKTEVNRALLDQIKLRRDQQKMQREPSARPAREKISQCKKAPLSTTNYKMLKELQQLRKKFLRTLESQRKLKIEYSRDVLKAKLEGLRVELRNLTTDTESDLRQLHELVDWTNDLFLQTSIFDASSDLWVVIGLLHCFRTYGSTDALFAGFMVCSLRTLELLTDNQALQKMNEMNKMGAKASSAFHKQVHIIVERLNDIGCRLAQIHGSRNVNSKNLLQLLMKLVFGKDAVANNCGVTVNVSFNVHSWETASIAGSEPHGRVTNPMFFPVHENKYNPLEVVRSFREFSFQLKNRCPMKEEIDEMINEAMRDL